MLEADTEDLVPGTNPSAPWVRFVWFLTKELEEKRKQEMDVKNVELHNVETEFVAQTVYSKHTYNTCQTVMKPIT